MVNIYVAWFGQLIKGSAFHSDWMIFSVERTSTKGFIACSFCIVDEKIVAAIILLPISVFNNTSQSRGSPLVVYLNIATFQNCLRPTCQGLSRLYTSWLTFHLQYVFISAVIVSLWSSPNTVPHDSLLAALNWTAHGNDFTKEGVMAFGPIVNLRQFARDAYDKPFAMYCRYHYAFRRLSSSSILKIK